MPVSVPLLDTVALLDTLLDTHDQASSALAIRQRRKTTNLPTRDSSDHPTQPPGTDKVEGAVKSEKNERFEGLHPHQQQRGAMAGSQRYLRYIIFALVVCSPHPPQTPNPGAIDSYRASFSSSSYHRPPYPRPTGPQDTLAVMRRPSPTQTAAKIKGRRPEPLLMLIRNYHLPPFPAIE